MTFDEELNELVKEAGITPASSSSSTNNKMTKSQFMSKYINDMYKRRYKERHNEAETYLIESAVHKKTLAEKRNRKGVLKYAEK